MSSLLKALFGLLTVFLFSQFGGRLTARNSVVWWCIFIFLGWCVIHPASLEPVAQILGIQLVSNFVLATMILFLVFQAIQESVFSTRQFRKLRDLISSLAVEAFLQKTRGDSTSTIAETPVRAATPVSKRVLVAMPCFNEETYLPQLKDQIDSFLRSTQDRSSEYQFCIINDGSTDGTLAFLERNLQGSFTTHLSNLGVSGALLTAFRLAERVGADYVVQCDSDGQHPLHEIPRMIEQAQAIHADLLVGSRYCGNQKDESTTWLRKLGSRLIRLLLRALFGEVNVSDPTSGLRVYSRQARRFLMQNMPDEYPEPESIALLLRQRMKVEEIYVKMVTRTTGVSSLNGLSGVRFMIKVMTALIGLRLRSLLSTLPQTGRQVGRN